MKNKIICLGVILLILSACKRESSTPTQSKLVQIKDSLNVFKLDYNSNGQVSEVWLDSTGWWQHYTPVAPIKYYSLSYGINYVRVNFPTGPNWLDTYVEYNLNSSKLPTNILVHRQINGVDSVVKETIFYYQNNTVTLDSIITFGNDKLKYVPQYSGGNIVQFMLSSGKYSYNLSFQCTYSSSLNPYRLIDPYLFIYLDPGFAENNTSFIPIIFSANAPQSFTAYNSTTGVTQLYNVNGQLLIEDWGINHPYQRMYVYQ